MNRQRLLDVLAYLEKMTANRKAGIAGYSVSLITNGTLITRHLAQQLSRYRIVQVSVSLDGPEDVHNRMRPSRYAGGGYRRTLAGLRAVATACPRARLAVCTTLQHENIDALGAEWLDFLKGLGVSVIRLDPDVLEDIPLPTEQIVDRLIALRRLAKAKGLTLSGSWEDPYQHLMQQCDGAESRFRCEAVMGGTPCVRPDGSIYPCAYIGYRLGHLDQFEAALAGAPFRKMLGATYSGLIPECKGCSIEGLCRGDCYSARLHRGAGSPSGSREKRCELLRMVFKAIVLEESKDWASSS